MNNLIQNINAPTQFHSLVYNELSNMPLREVYVIWEMIRVMKQNHQTLKPKTQNRSFNFERSQTILKNIKGSLSDDIIKIEREDRI